MDNQGEILQKTRRLKNLAIANPKLAPFGAASVEVMRNLGVYEALKPKLVMGENIAQTFHFVYSGNASLGFVSLSHLSDRASDALRPGSFWIVPTHLHTPIRQDAVLLKRGEKNEVALAFMSFLKSDVAREIILQYGYALD